MVSDFLADYENFYPKGKKEIPKGDQQKSKSKGKHKSYLLECYLNTHFGTLK